MKILLLLRRLVYMFCFDFLGLRFVEIRQVKFVHPSIYTLNSFEANMYQMSSFHLLSASFSGNKISVLGPWHKILYSYDPISDMSVCVCRAIPIKIGFVSSACRVWPILQTRRREDIHSLHDVSQQKLLQLHFWTYQFCYLVQIMFAKDRRKIGFAWW